MIDYTLKITQTGDQLHITGKVETLIDMFELGEVKLGKIENGQAIILAEVRERARKNIFASGLIAVNVTFTVPQKLSRIQLVVNNRFDVWLDVTQA